MPWLLLLAFLSSCSGQTLTLTGPATASPGATVPVLLSLTGTSPAALQWTLDKPSGSQSTADGGPAGIAAGKTLSCAGDLCLLHGLNATEIQPGVVAQYTLTVPSTPGIHTLTLTGSVGATGIGEPLSMAAVPYVVEVAASGPPYPVTGLRVEIAEASAMSISWVELTEGSSPNNPASTASISPTANVPVFVTVAGSLTGAGTATVTVSGCSLTWTKVGEITQWGSRRFLSVWHGVGASPTTGTLTIEITTGYTFEQMKWSADQATGVDAATPYGTAYTNLTAGATSLAVTVSATPDAGDHVFAAFALEDDYATSLNAELETKLTDFGDATGARHLTVAYDSAPDSSPTPGITWSTNCAAGALAFIVNAAAGGPSVGNPVFVGQFLDFIFGGPIVR